LDPDFTAYIEREMPDVSDRERERNLDVSELGADRDVDIFEQSLTHRLCTCDRHT
jgi:hypothetical protein